MTESPSIGVLNETGRHLLQAREDLYDIWRHEGMKKGAEFALHQLGLRGFGRGILERLAEGGAADPRLAIAVNDLMLSSPVGIGAGWDKTGKSILGLQALGADHATIGGVPFYPQAGNRMPRLLSMDKRIGDHGTAVSLNSYGFYSPGVHKVVHNIAKQRETGAVRIPVEVQITLNKEFYEEGKRHMIPVMIAETIRQALPVADVIGLGLTSPNTLGMRDAQEQYDFIRDCVMAAREATITSSRRVQLAYKGDGDGGERRLDMYCRLIEETELDIIELINSTAQPHVKEKYGAEHLPGGLAGADPEFQQMALDAVKYVYEALGDKVIIDGMGGINTPAQNVAMMRAGASKTSIVTSLQQNRTQAFCLLKQGLLNELDKPPQHQSVKELVGLDTARGPLTGNL